MGRYRKAPRILIVPDRTLLSVRSSPGAVSMRGARVLRNQRAKVLLGIRALLAPQLLARRPDAPYRRFPLSSLLSSES